MAEFKAVPSQKTRSSSALGATLWLVQKVRTIVQAGTGYDLLLTCVTIADPDTQNRIAGAREYRKRAKAVGAGTVFRQIDHVGREPWINLLGFAHSMTDEPSAAAVVKAVGEADPRELVLAAIGHSRRAFRMMTPPQVIRDAVDGDKKALREFRRTSYPDLKHWQGTLRRWIPMGVEEAAGEMVAGLRGWYEGGFVEMEPEVAKLQAAEATRVRDLVARVTDLNALLEQLSPTITFTREVGQDVAVLVPSVIVRPRWALSDYGPTMVIAYGIPEPAPTMEGDADTARLLALAKAMGDELRLRALRELRDGPLSASELATRLGIPRTSIHHHLQILMGSGLVRVAVDDARWGNFELQPGAAEELGRLASSWLKGD
jgi:DNA-binding transcriptional ArsR family regulator